MLSYIAVGLAVLALVVVLFTHNSQGGANTNTAFSKVMSSGTMRVGYIPYPPYVIQDPKTGALSGIFYDLTNQVAGQLGLKVQWVEEAGYGTIFTDLSAGRYDVFGGGLWANSTRAKAGYLTIPAFYNGVYAYVRTSDHRFDNNLAAINDPSVKISTQDGELGQTIAQQDYPKAQQVSIPQSAPFDQIALQVMDNKADVAFLQPDAAAEFLKANPNTLRQLQTPPLRLYGNAYAVALGEGELQQMLNVAIQEAIDDGSVANIVAKYQASTHSYLLPSTPYTP